MKIKSYLAILICSCLLGGYLVEYALSEEFRAVQKKTELFSNARLWLNNLERVNSDTSQYLISADLVIASGETYLAPGAQSKGELISTEVQQLIDNNQLLPDAVQLKELIQLYRQTNHYIKLAYNASGEERDQILNSLLVQYDKSAYQLSFQLDELLSTTTSLLNANSNKLEEMREHAKSTQITTRILFSLALLLLWFWANRQICHPVSQLSAMAKQAIDGIPFKGVTHGPKETLLLSDNLTSMADNLSHQATHDPLTNLHNRLAFQRMLLSDEFSFCEENTGNVLCFIDLDRFKIVNDSCGHSAGDKLLVQIAETLQSCIQPSDFLARLGGDEFVVLLSDCDIDKGLKVCHSIRESIGNIRFAWNEEIYNVSASIGITHFDQSITETLKPQEILNTADIACKYVKEHGRNNVQVFDLSDETVTKQRQESSWLQKLNTALEQGDFTLHKQDITPLGTQPEQGRYFEILLRMNGEESSLLSPAVFIPLVERYNLCTQLDIWVINAVINWLLDNPNELETTGMCSINLSGQSMASEEVRGFIASKLQTTNFPAEKLCFEITETAAVSNLSNAQLLMEELSGLGCKFALDDFGSGLSSFAYLKKLPVDIIKIDGEFVKNMHEDSINRATVEAISCVAKAIGKKTVAEFVENSQIASMLEEMGIDYAQGYYFNKPEPLESLKRAPQCDQKTNTEEKKLAALL